MTIQYDYYIKILVLGDSKTGKTNLVSNLCGNDFDEIHIPTIGLDFKTTYLDIDKKEFNEFNEFNEINEKIKIKIQFVDCSGSERFMSLLKNFSKKSEIIIMLYDVTKKSTLENIEKWYKILENFNYKYDDDIVKILIGNKKDLSENIRVGYNEGKEIANKYGMEFFEVSTKNENLKNLILNNSCKKIIQNYKNNFEQNNYKQDSDKINLLSKKKNYNKCCNLL